MSYTDRIKGTFRAIHALNSDTAIKNAVIVMKQKVRQQVADWEGHSSLHYNINARGKLEKWLNEVTVNGKVVSRSKGMDCDCSAWDRATLTDRPQLFAEHRSIESAYEWADGPLSIWYERPSEGFENFNNSRDLALEAYEEGHPHVVYY